MEQVAPAPKGPDEQKPTKKDEILAISSFFEMVDQCGQTAKEHGFWDSHKQTALKLTKDIKNSAVVIEELCKVGIIGDPAIFIGLMTTEIAEATEALRNGQWRGKDGVWEELADTLIRIADFVCRFGPARIDDDKDVSQAEAIRQFFTIVKEKMAKNEGRPHLHGKSY